MAKPPARPLGQAGEDVAVRFLSLCGLSIVERNLRSRLGEIDVVARDGETLVFVEVKARQEPRGDPPQAAVNTKKRARLARLALGYLRRHRMTERRCRFDVVAVTLDPGGGVLRVEHFPDAFTVDGWAG